MTDRIKVTVFGAEKLEKAVKDNLNYICSETLANEIRMTNDAIGNEEIELVEGIKCQINILKQ